ncbi:hypothetical protein [Aliivibrio logei]|uniref:Uncharacterized protein n=1 Tax=Aliivibrio logei TaxID=688 RepID=A0A1B9P0Y0_ALILO|nr:hypothetical protein [Aliivibrio logei]OCH22016.1 hypothetical protein A6E04_09175 [Aliivibrio logei]
MSYLPFYITPEEFEQECFKNKEKIEHSVGSMQWIAKNIEHKNRYDRKLFWSGCVAFSILLIAFVTGFDIEVWTLENELGYGFIPILIIINYIYYFVFALDDRYEYSFSSEGFSYSKQLDQPKIINSIAQKVAYVACVFCVLAVIVIGPMALVGAGGSLLLAFGMTKKQTVYVDHRFSSTEQFLYAQFNRKRNVIALYHRFDMCDYGDTAHTIISRDQTRSRSYVFFNSDDDMAKVLDLLKQNTNIKIEEITDIKGFFDFDYYPKFVLDINVIGEQYPVDEATSRRGEPAPVMSDR